MPFNPLEYPQVFHEMLWKSGQSAWVEHTPFVGCLMALLRPGTFVELGTHWGDSYCAFCQAVRELQLPTRCTAVDTWRGDAHSGPYDEQVFQTLSAFNAGQFGGFSRLWRTDFDSAARETPDGSVDLLHIDGLHTYEAVRHDFEAWLPKLSGCGVVLFHDTAVRTGDFGVYKLYAEAAAGRTSFEFHHGFGLGILAVGSAVPEAFLAFLREAGANPEPVRGFFQAMGYRSQVLSMMSVLCRQMHGVQVRLNALARHEGKAVPPEADDPVLAFRNPMRYMGELGANVLSLIDRGRGPQA